MPGWGQPHITTRRPIRAKLIFNAIAGRPDESPGQLTDILTELQDQGFLPEVFLIRPGSRVRSVIQQAVNRGIRLIAVAGGDGTIDSVASAAVGTGATLGFIPTGTRNNIAYSLGIPASIPEAVDLLRRGRRVHVDVGQVRTQGKSRWFLEAATLGLLSALYPAADDVQHGNLARLGDLLATLVTAGPSRLRLVLDEGRERLDTSAHAVLIANMPYIGPRFQVAPDVSCVDSRLDVVVYSHLSKLDLLSYAVQASAGLVDDPRVKHYRVKRLSIQAEPHMPVLVDGDMLGEGPLSAQVHPRALTIIAGPHPAGQEAKQSE